tara:strand:+ start:2744 stop:3634 length:891 start_codon:yes stop_codon:yes gene_type:complete
MIRLLVLVLIFLTKSFNITAQKVFLSADNLEVSIDDISRIITIGGSITETTFALGLGKNVVATDVSSNYPEEILKLPRVSYIRSLTAEGILSLNPSLVLASDDAKPKIVIDQLRDAGLNFILIKEGLESSDIISKISDLGFILDRNIQADSITQSITEKLNEARIIVDDLVKKPKVLFVLSQQTPNSFLVAGSKTEASSIIEFAGGINAFDNFSGYKPVTSESLIEANPDFILFMSSRGESLSHSLTETSMINTITAVKKNQIISMDGNFLLGFGPRFGEAVETLLNHLHPDVNEY